MSTSAEIQVGTAIFFQDTDGEPESICPFLLEQVEDAQMLDEQAGVESLDAHRLLLMLLREDVTLREIQPSIRADYIYKITPEREIYWKQSNKDKWTKFLSENKK